MLLVRVVEYPLATVLCLKSYRNGKWVTPVNDRCSRGRADDDARKVPTIENAILLAEVYD